MAKTKQIQKDVTRFEPVQEARIITKLSKILSQSAPVSEEQAIKQKQFAVIDPACVCLVIAKTEQAKRVLARFGDNELKLKGEKIPELDYKTKTKVSCKYSMDYLPKIIDFFKVADDDEYGSGSIVMQMKTDHPLSIENDHFRAILAPRVDND